MDVKHPLSIQQPMQLQEPPAAASQNPNPPSSTDAPPKQVALAMERLGQASRLIADVRLGADRLLEALFIAAVPHQRNKPLQLFVKEDASMRQHLQDLRSVGRQLEESGVLNETLRSRSNSWGLHLPVVCPDGAVVAYAWKRQLAGQAGASAVDRTRLALKAFTDQKRRFFPHLDEGQDVQSTEPASKKHCTSKDLLLNYQEELSDCKTLSDILTRLEKEMLNMKVLTYERLDWFKRASSLPASASENPLDTSKDHGFHSLSKLRTVSQSAAATDKIAIIELFFPSVFRAIISLHPAGSIDPDAVAFFSPDEGGSYIHARGFSVHHVFRKISEHAAMALQHFLGVSSRTALYSIVHWICCYQTLFTKVCSKCGKLLAMDRKSLLLLPPVYRPYRHFSTLQIASTQNNSLAKDQGLENLGAFHIGCFTEEL
ncbi:34 KDA TRANSCRIPTIONAL CO-ACTIVATOR-RELATED [Salix purpurea]|uniref:34 kDa TRANSCRIPTIONAL CO-ACTIVATOR-RELATED n=1 Tax=Salix purpurea TaxID=77065 RepID=A0A9Q1A330_SALPP|nr:34 KDA TRANSCRIPTIONAL CO-ACTIVATOR-RELATED [Salix purpurea]